MGKQNSSEKHFLNLAGEYAVCSELAKRNITSSITFGNHKAADIIAVNLINKTSVVIEVKTTRSNKFVTSFFQKYKVPDTPHPDIWILVHINKDNQSEFYILSHKEIAKEQMIRNKMKNWHYVNGVDNILIKQITKYKNNWNTIPIN